jgi:hypothetical protein
VVALLARDVQAVVDIVHLEHLILQNPLQPPKSLTSHFAFPRFLADERGLFRDRQLLQKRER